MGNYLGIPLLMLAAALQVSFIPQIRILGGEPDFPFLLVLSWAVFARLEEGVAWAVFGGIVRDLVTAAPTGTSVLGMVIVVFIVDRLKQQIFGVGLIPLVGLVIGGTFLQKLIYLFVITFAGYEVPPLDMLTYVILPTVAYNLVVFWPVYWFVRRFLRPSAEPRRID